MSDTLSMCNSFASLQAPTQALDDSGMPSNTWRTVAYNVPVIVDFGGGNESQRYGTESAREEVTVVVPNHLQTSGTIYSQLRPKSRFVLTHDGGFLTSTSTTTLEIQSVAKVYGNGGVVEFYRCRCTDTTK